MYPKCFDQFVCTKMAHSITLVEEGRWKKGRLQEPFQALVLELCEGTIMGWCPGT